MICNKQSSPFFIVVTALFCLNFGSKDTSIAGRAKPAINFYGTLEDTNGRTYKVENITVSYEYKQIQCYAKPKDTKTDPTINISRIDLSEVAAISVPRPNDILTYNGREYIEILITSKDKERTQETYIIEKSKRVICDQINTAGPIEKDLSFQGIVKITITGYVEKKADETEKESKNQGG